MKKSEIKIGGRYVAKVSNRLTTVIVNSIEKRRKTQYAAGGTRYHCTNLATGRQVIFKTAMKFRGEAVSAEDQAKIDKWDADAREDKARQAASDMKKAKPSLAGRVNAQKTAMEKAAIHIVVEALAGTGKTFTMIVGVLHALAPKLWDQFIDELRKMTGNDELDIVPSDEQAAIWDYMKQFNGMVSSVVYCAFNRSIVSEFAEQWGFMIDLLAGVGINLRFATVNSLGNQACSRAFGRLRVTDFHTDNIVEKLTGIDNREMRRNDPLLLSATKQITGLCKLNLTGWTEGKKFNADDITEEDLDEIVAHYDIDLNGGREKVYDLVPKVLMESMQVDRWKEIDFNDQNWLPVVLRLPIPKTDLLIVDEGQDLPRCKQEFCRRAARNLSVVGDVNQAIYGFAGADVDSIPRMKKLLGTDDAPLKPFFLTETRRCGKAIVAEANVALREAYLQRDETPVEFLAHDTNSAGEVLRVKKTKFIAMTADGDMVVSRVNAPLVSYALQLIRDGRKANIRGREFGTELVNFIKRMKATDVSDLLDKVDNWYEKESQKEARKRNASDAKLIMLEDRRNCIEALSSDANSINDIITKVETIFSGKKCPKCGRNYSENVERCPNKACKTETDPLSGYPCGPRLVTPKGVLFSSVHRAKGLEADKVFVLLCDGSMFPHPMAKTGWQIGQEYNLKYVAVTRAINTLVYVTK